MKERLLAERGAWAARYGDANLANAGPALTSSMHGSREQHDDDRRAPGQRSR
ncbi:hypothetical protein ACJ51O_11165 [Burkholderia pyrrocinia]|uniref:hypothetical protein n=1 Tax=Burkholderia TaxID=32008 RepID=UPI00137668CB|nr:MULTISPECIES: hypothetical protein [Burkholderia]